MSRIGHWNLTLPNDDVISVDEYEDHLVLQSTNEKHILADRATPHGIKVWLHVDEAIDGGKT